MTEKNEQQASVSSTKQKGLFAEFEYPTYEGWKSEVEKALKGTSFEGKMFTKTYEGITLQPIYRAEDTDQLESAKTAPGFYPYVRGSVAAGYLKTPWAIAQECDDVLPEQFNLSAKNELERGSTALNIILDTATKTGFDASCTNCTNIGGDGLSISTIDDLNRAMAGIDVSAQSVLVYTGASAVGIMALFAAYARANGVATQDIKGCIGSDPLGELAQNGVVRYSLPELYNHMAQVTEWASNNAPQLQTIFPQGLPYNNAGANAIQELAFTLAAATDYLKAMHERGLSIDIVSPRIRFSFALGANVFMEIAKLRAARMLWSQIVAAFGGNSQAQKMTIHARTATYTKTVYDPYVNMLRTTTEAFSGVVGGADSMHVAGFDEPIRKSDEFSRRIARNTQIMLQQECNMLSPVDPGGGSYYIEFLTNTIAEKAWELFQQIDEQGGMFEALFNGTPQAMIVETARQRQSNLSKRRDVIVGTNMYSNLEEKPLDVKTLNHQELRKIRSEEIQTYRDVVDDIKLQQALAVLQQEYQNGNMQSMSAAIDSALSGATLGEITKALRTDSSIQQVAPLHIHRLADKYEKLRRTTEQYFARTGNNLTVFLANMGPIPQHKARADFSRGFCEVGGFKVLQNDGFTTVDEAVEAAVKADPDVVIICSTDKTYPELVPPLAMQIKSRKPDVTVILAGLPPEDLQSVYKEAGVDEFIHVRADCFKILSSLQKKRGMDGE